MNNPSTAKIECPACGQHYSLEIEGGPSTITCQKCGAEFVAALESDSADSDRRSAVAPPKTEAIGLDSPGSDEADEASLAEVDKVPFLDRFRACGLRFVRLFSWALALLFLLGILLGVGGMVLNLGTSIDVPTFESLASAANNKNSPHGGDMKDIDNRREVEKRFGDEILGMVRAHGLAATAYDGIVQIVISIDKRYQKPYLSGLNSALKAAKKELDKGAAGSESLSLIDTAELYTNAFRAAEEKAKSSSAEATLLRWEYLGLAFASCALLFLILTLSTLLKIEANTRKPA